MSDLRTEKNEMLDAVKRPDRKKRQPSNVSLYAALVFANLVFALLDVISGLTVYWMTKFALYGILTFLAGFVPLLLHEFLYTRAYASEFQKKIAVTGAVTALVSIICVGLAAGYINVVGLVLSEQGAEIAIIAALVLIASFHAVLAVVYFYADEGIVAQQITAQAIANAIQVSKQIEAGAMILDITKRRVENRKKIGALYDPAALTEVLRQMGIDATDADGDGIPDVLQRKPQMQSYNSEARLQVPEHGNNGHRGDSSDPN